MPNDTTQPDNSDSTTGSDTTDPSTTGSGTKDPTGVEGANPALDDTGKPKAEGSRRGPGAARESGEP